MIALMIECVLLTILVKRIIVSVEGEIVDYELQPPFAYVRKLAECLQDVDEEECSSGRIRLRTLSFVAPTFAGDATRQPYSA